MRGYFNDVKVVIMSFRDDDTGWVINGKELSYAIEPQKEGDGSVVILRIVTRKTAVKVEDDSAAIPIGDVDVEKATNNTASHPVAHSGQHASAPSTSATATIAKGSDRSTTADIRTTQDGVPKLLKICTVPGCESRSKYLLHRQDGHGPRGYRCRNHGGVKCGVKRCKRRSKCIITKADKWGPRKPRCEKHGGGVPCNVEGCALFARIRTYANDHFGPAGSRCARHIPKRRRAVRAAPDGGSHTDAVKVANNTPKATKKVSGEEKTVFPRKISGSAGKSDVSSEVVTAAQKSVCPAEAVHKDAPTAASVPETGEAVHADEPARASSGGTQKTVCKAVPTTPVSRGTREAVHKDVPTATSSPGAGESVRTDVPAAPLSRGTGEAAQTDVPATASLRGTRKTVHKDVPTATSSPGTGESVYTDVPATPFSRGTGEAVQTDARTAASSHGTGEAVQTDVAATASLRGTREEIQTGVAATSSLRETGETVCKSVPAGASLRGTGETVCKSVPAVASSHEARKTAHKEVPTAVFLRGRRKAALKEVPTTVFLRGARQAVHKDVPATASSDGTRKAVYKDVPTTVSLRGRRKAAHKGVPTTPFFRISEETVCQDVPAIATASFDGTRKAVHKGVAATASSDGAKKTAHKDASATASLRGRRKAVYKDASATVSLRGRRKAVCKEALATASLRGRRKAVYKEAPTTVSVRGRRKAVCTEAPTTVSLRGRRKAVCTEALTTVSLRGRRKAVCKEMPTTASSHGTGEAVHKNVPTTASSRGAGDVVRTPRSLPNMLDPARTAASVPGAVRAVGATVSSSCVQQAVCTAPDPPCGSDRRAFPKKRASIPRTPTTSPADAGTAVEKRCSLKRARRVVEFVPASETRKGAGRAPALAHTLSAETTPPLSHAGNVRKSADVPQKTDVARIPRCVSGAYGAARARSALGAPSVTQQSDSPTTGAINAGNWSDTLCVQETGRKRAKDGDTVGSFVGRATSKTSRERKTADTPFVESTSLEKTSPNPRQPLHETNNNPDASATVAGIVGKETTTGIVCVRGRNPTTKSARVKRTYTFRKRNPAEKVSGYNANTALTHDPHKRSALPIAMKWKAAKHSVCKATNSTIAVKLTAASKSVGKGKRYHCREAWRSVKQVSTKVNATDTTATGNDTRQRISKRSGRQTHHREKPPGEGHAPRSREQGDKKNICESKKKSTEASVKQVLAKGGARTTIKGNIIPKVRETKRKNIINAPQRKNTVRGGAGGPNATQEKMVARLDEPVIPAPGGEYTTCGKKTIEENGEKNATTQKTVFTLNFAL